MPIIAMYPVLALMLAQQPALTRASLDFEFFKARVQPILQAKREGHARCISCHTSGSPMRLQPIAQGAATWTEEDARKNFDIIRLRVNPGNPTKSKLLTHPLAGAAGGDENHDGGKHWQSQTDPEWQTLAAWLNGASLKNEAKAPTGKVRIIQTNSAGDNVHIIDPATNKIVGEIKGIEVNHGEAAAPDGSHIYVSNEADSTLDVVDGRTLKVTTKIKLSGHPNNISISRDGGRVYVAIREDKGAVDVIDTVALKNIKSIPIKGAGHNTYVTPDGRYDGTGNNVTAIRCDIRVMTGTLDGNAFDVLQRDRVDHVNSSLVLADRHVDSLSVTAN